MRFQPIVDRFSHAHQGLQTWILSLGQGLQCHDQLEDGEFNHKRSRQSTNSLLYVLDGKILLDDRPWGSFSVDGGANIKKKILGSTIKPIRL